MFFKQISQERAEETRKVNKLINDTLNNYFATEYLTIREEMIAGGIAPEKIDELLKQLKRDMQVELIRRFKEILQQIVIEESQAVNSPPQLGVDNTKR